MSYNIDCSQYQSGKLSISSQNVQAMRHKHKDWLPAVNFLDDFADAAPDEECVIKEPDWYGECSGHSFDALKEILSHTKGEAILVFVWEGGDSFSALKVKDGVVTAHKAKVVIDEDSQ